MLDLDHEDGWIDVTLFTTRKRLPSTTYVHKSSTASIQTVVSPLYGSATTISRLSSAVPEGRLQLGTISLVTHWNPTGASVNSAVRTAPENVSSRARNVQPPGELSRFSPDLIADAQRVGSRACRYSLRYAKERILRAGCIPSHGAESENPGDGGAGLGNGHAGFGDGNP